MMKKTLFIAVACMLCGAMKGQTNALNIYGTYQGEIVGVSSLILHLKSEAGVATGFYKALSDRVVVQFRGTVDSEGNLMLTTIGRPYPSFSGKLEGGVIKGCFTRSKRAAPHVFYACDLRGMYEGANGTFSEIALSDKGYLRNGSVIATHMDDDGRISIIDSLNNRFYIKGDTLVADNDAVGEEHRVYTPSYLYDYDSDSFVEFPEMRKEIGTNELGSSSKRYELGNNLSVRMRQIPYSDYILAKWRTAHLPKNKPYKVITNNRKIMKILRAKGRIEVIERKIEGGDKKEDEEDEVEAPNYMINVICYDGVKRTILDYYNSSLDYPLFNGYYPELEVLVFEEEAGGDGVIDFNDSSNDVRNPFYDLPSPDKKFLFTGYYPGGAADGVSWHIGRWNRNKKRYEFTASLSYAPGVLDWLTYTDRDDWFWSEPDKVIFKTPDYGDRVVYYYEMEIIEN